MFLDKQGPSLGVAIIEEFHCIVFCFVQGLWPASYKVNNVIRHGHPVALNPDHTHFLLIDDGNRGRYDGVADFRASLERKISLPVDNGEGKLWSLSVVLNNYSLMIF